MKPLILCLGNEVIADDAFGAVVAERLEADALVKRRADVIFAPVAGFALIDLLTGRPRVLVVDTIRTGRAAPGTLTAFPADTLAPTRHLTSSHQISLPTALQLSQELGIPVPRQVDVLAVEAADLETLGVPMTPEVAAAIPKTLDRIKEWILHSSLPADPFERLATARTASRTTIVTEEL